MGLAVQPALASLLFMDEVANEQGFTARFLLSNPQSTVGTRFYRKPQVSSEADLRAYADHLLKILDRPLPVSPTNPQELTPRVLALSDEAKAVWVEFYNGIEAMLAKNEKLEIISAFGSKISENALRLAAVLTLIDDIDATEINLDTWERATKLLDYFTTETLRLYEAGSQTYEMALADKFLDWLHNKWTEPLIALSIVYQYGPKEIRNATQAKKVIETLVEHGWLTPYAGKGIIVGGKKAIKAWAIIREAK
jgi:hypothetical protein